MKAYVRHEMGVVGWMEKPDPVCADDAVICKPIAISPCSSEVHTAWEMDGAWLKDITLGHEALGEIIEAGPLVKDFKVGDKVIVPCTTPTWKHPDIQDSYHQDAGGMFQGINFSNYEDGVMAEKFVVRSTDIISYKEGDIVEQIIKLTDNRGSDVCIVAGGSAETLSQAYAATKCGGHMVNLNVITGVSEFTFDYATSGGGFMGHKTINGGLCPGGRKRAERLTSMLLADRVDTSKLITHTFHGFDKIGEALQMMKDKPADLIKPIVYCD